MTDYTTNTGSGGVTFASDTEASWTPNAGHDLPVSKMAWGALGSAQRVTTAQPLPVADQNVLANISAKGTQAANGIGVQSLKDSGRTYVTLYIDAIAGVATEALVTMNINTGGTVTTGTSWTVPTGKTFRLQAFEATVEDSTTTAVYGRVRLRSAATVSATSGIIANAACAGFTGTAVAGAGSSAGYAIPDGLEIAAGQQIGMTDIVSSASSLVSAIATGYYY